MGEGRARLLEGCSLGSCHGARGRQEGRGRREQAVMGR